MLFLFVFLMTFAPVLDIGLGLFADMIVLVSLGLIALDFLVKFEIVLERKIVALLSILFVLFTYSMFTTLVFDATEVDRSARGVLRTIKAIINFLGCYVLVKWYLQNHGERAQHILAQHVFFAVSLHGLIMVLQFAIPEFKQFIYSFTLAKYQLEHYQMFRMAGLANAGGAQLSAFQSMGFFIGIYLLFSSKEHRAIIWLCMVVIVLSTFLSGRTGLFAILAFGPLFALYLAFLNGPSSMMKTGVVFGTIIGVTIAVILTLYANDFYGNTYLKVAFDRNFDTFIARFEGSQKEDDTFKALKKMWLFPAELTTFLFGKTHILGVGVREVHSDIGFIRFLWGYGLVGSLIVYSFIVLQIVYVLQTVNLTRKAKAIAWFSLLLIFVFHTKEEFVLTRHGLSICSLLVLPIILKNSFLKNRYSST